MALRTQQKAKTMKKLLLSLVLGWSCVAPILSSEAASEPPAAVAAASTGNAMTIKVKIAGNEIAATLIDSETSRDFVSLLPLALTLNDLFGREKFGHLLRAISKVESGRGHTRLAT